MEDDYILDNDLDDDFDYIEPDPYADWVDAQYDDDPSPYAGTYSED